MLNESTRILDALGFPYALVGGLAVSVWASPRATRDVDLYARIPDAAHATLQAELELRSFHVPAMSEELQRFGVFRSKHLLSGVFLDIFDAVGPLGETILRRRKQIHYFERQFWVISAEDLILLKAFSDRARDFDDLLVICAQRHANLDNNYIDEWARLLDSSIGSQEVSERLAKARAAAGTDG